MSVNLAKRVGVLSSLTLTTALAINACSVGSNTKDESHGPALNTSEVVQGKDDGSQMKSPFRLNYAGYLPLQEKVAVYISQSDKPLKWAVKNASGEVVLEGESTERRENDFASGDSFHLVNFSALQAVGEGYYLSVDGNQSASFSISNDPYGGLKYEFYDYFQDHRREGDVFDRYVHNWSDRTVQLNFIADAGDQGYYTVNAAEAQWSLINLLEDYPEINEYYSSNAEGMSTVYDELVFFSSPMDKVIFPGEKLAIAKFATFSNDTYAVCTGATGTSGDCVSRPETKATYSVARTLAAMSRLHDQYGSSLEKERHYEMAKQAYINASTEPYVCLTWEDFGGEGGYYPNNDNWGLWRDPRSHRAPCADGPQADPGDNNIRDDEYAALVELYIAADKFGFKEDTVNFRKKVEAHPHHNRVDKFFFGAVSTEATLSLLTNQPKGLDLKYAKANVYAFADKVLEHQKVGYPGVTFDVKSNEWDAQDREDVDNNWRWGSNRMQLNDARILMKAAHLAYENKQYQKAADYTNGVLKVLDQISGTNAVALAMYTADSYSHIEHAVTRTHDALVPDTEDGKMALGPNNWTNAHDPHMPAFGSKPGMKMFALTGTGWSSREIAIDGNASLVPVAYFATEIAPVILEAASQASK